MPDSVRRLSSSSVSAVDNLTPEEKKAHHIQSEQKRRQVIRDAFDELTVLVPGLGRSQSKSEAIVLRRTVEYIREQEQECAALEAELSRVSQQDASTQRI